MAVGNDEEYYIPRHLDEPPKVFIWPLDEVAILAAFVVWGVMTDAKLIGFVFGFFAMSGVKRIKRSEGGRIFRNALYWYLPANIGGGKSLAPSYVRKWNG